MKVSPKLPLNLEGLSRRWPFGGRPTAPTGLLPDVVHPVLVLPGILGTWPPAPAPKGRLDPISGTYHNLIEGLTRLGYRSGESLFAFPYDWRRSVSDLVGVLRAEISRIKRLTPVTRPDGGRVDYSQVDLLCHSMGGVIGRAYVQSDAYGDDVARLLLVAAPQTGSLAAYFAYEGGDSTLIGVPVEGARSMAALAKARDLRLSSRLQHTYRALRGRDLPDLYAYMQAELHSIQDFLPLARQNYLYRLDEGGHEQLYPFGEPPGHPANEPLERMNRPEYMDRLDRVAEIACFYSSSVPTLARLQVEQPGPAPLYQHGRPIAHQPATNRVPGDSIVGIFSSRLELSATRSDGQPWRMRLRNEDMSVALGQSLNHVGIVADPAPVRYLLDNFTRPDAPALTAALWDGPALATRRPNYAALII